MSQKFLEQCLLWVQVAAQVKRFEQNLPKLVEEKTLWQRIPKEGPNLGGPGACIQ
jgi:hypothetical protein